MGLSTWPNLIVGIGWLAGLASPFIVFGRFARMFTWWKTRRGLFWPNDRVRFVLAVKSAMKEQFTDESGEDDWMTWDTFGRLLYGFRRYEDALNAMELAKETDLRHVAVVLGRMSSNEADEAEVMKLVELAGRYHDSNIEFVKAAAHVSS
jgi:hypothetical protein